MTHSLAFAALEQDSKTELRAERRLSQIDDAAMPAARPEPEPQTVAKRIEVYLSAQLLIAWEGDQKVNALLVTTGQEGQETLAGEFQILDKEVDSQPPDHPSTSLRTGLTTQPPKPFPLPTNFPRAL